MVALCATSDLANGLLVHKISSCSASRMGKFVALMIFVTHMAGCLWMVPVMYGDCPPSSEVFNNPIIHSTHPSVNCGSLTSNFVEQASDKGLCTNWLKDYSPELVRSGAPWSSKYLVAIYFAVVTLSTVGYGDVTPTNDSERIFAASLALLGAVIFAYCIGSISTLANQENETEAEIDETLRGLHDFLQVKNCSIC